MPAIRVATIIGTRPEIIKMAPLLRLLERSRHTSILIHSGQHFDYNMDRVFFKGLELREPDFNFTIRDLPVHQQLSIVLRRAGDILAREKAEFVLVHGDTNTTMAGAITARNQRRTLGHVEAGIRSFDRTMPEEVNRVVADQMSDYHFAPTATARTNLLAEGISSSGISVVGNTVVDALLQHIRIGQRRSRILRDLGLEPRGYILLTYHRQENVDIAKKLKSGLKGMAGVAADTGLRVVFPIHPRTRRRLKEFGLEGLVERDRGFIAIDPVGYLDFLVLEASAALIATDSGGLQEEGCVLRVPCITLRENTERPESLAAGSNILVGTDERRIVDGARRMLDRKRNWRNPFGDGKTAARILRILDAV